MHHMIVGEPMVTIEQSSSVVDPIRNISNPYWDVRFTKGVVGLVPSDFQVTGTAIIASASLTRNHSCSFISRFSSLNHRLYAATTIAVGSSLTDYTFSVVVLQPGYVELFGSLPDRILPQ
jgi:hypothetical protein